MKTMTGTQDKKKKRARRRSKAKLVSRVIARVEQKLDSEELKPSVGDLIRLLQLEKELKQEEKEPTEIKVSWVDRDERDCASGK